jgi:hypothetical protein
MGLGGEFSTGDMGKFHPALTLPEILKTQTFCKGTIRIQRSHEVTLAR